MIAFRDEQLPVVTARDATAWFPDQGEKLPEPRDLVAALADKLQRFMLFDQLGPDPWSESRHCHLSGLLRCRVWKNDGHAFAVNGHTDAAGTAGSSDPVIKIVAVQGGCCLVGGAAGQARGRWLPDDHGGLSHDRIKLVNVHDCLAEWEEADRDHFEVSKSKRNTND